MCSLVFGQTRPLANAHRLWLSGCHEDFEYGHVIITVGGRFPRDGCSLDRVGPLWHPEVDFMASSMAMQFHRQHPET